MKTFKTPKGTELPLMDLKGKIYLQVAHRIVWFREEHPLGRIDTECVEKTDNYVIYKATISIIVPSDPGNATYEYTKLSDAVKQEYFENFADAHEKAQTGAIGRALALIGYGTQFTSDLDEGERLADAPLDKGSQIFDANIPYDPSFTVPIGKNKGKRIDEVPLEELKSTANWILDKKDKGEKIGNNWVNFLTQVELMVNSTIEDIQEGLLSVEKDAR